MDVSTLSRNLQVVPRFAMNRVRTDHGNFAATDGALEKRTNQRRLRELEDEWPRMDIEGSADR
jgi:hypothetical protein